MNINGTGKRYSITGMTLDELTAVVLGLADYSEKRGTDTVGYSMLCEMIEKAERAGSIGLANSIRAILPGVET